MVGELWLLKASLVSSGIILLSDILVLHIYDETAVILRQHQLCSKSLSLFTLVRPFLKQTPGLTVLRKLPCYPFSFSNDNTLFG